MGTGKTMTPGDLFYVLLQILFIYMKMAGINDMSYWIVFSPTLAVFGLAFVVAVVTAVTETLKNNRK